MESNFLTVKELAEKLRVPKSWVYARTRETGSNAMPRLKVGKYRRFILRDVLEYLKKQTEEQ